VELGSCIVRKEVPHPGTDECPLCGRRVPAEIVRLRGPFYCPSCGKALKISKTYEVAVRLIALAIGLLLALAARLESFWLFCVGLMIWPFLVVPVWRTAAALKRPPLVPSGPEVTKLDLTGR
jgi:uncharacterized paraquat-inducible protein A